MGRTQADKGRDEIHAVGVANIADQRLQVGQCTNHTQAVPQPLDGSPRDEYRALQTVGDLTVQRPSDGRQQPGFRLRRLRPGVHEQKASRAVCVLRRAGSKHV